LEGSFLGAEELKGLRVKLNPGPFYLSLSFCLLSNPGKYDKCLADYFFAKKQENNLQGTKLFVSTVRMSQME
jgi:hypothetical protein